MGYRLWGHTESDTTEATQQQQQQQQQQCTYVSAASSICTTSPSPPLSLESISNTFPSSFKSAHPEDILSLTILKISAFR